MFYSVFILKISYNLLLVYSTTVSLKCEDGLWMNIRVVKQFLFKEFCRTLCLSYTQWKLSAIARNLSYPASVNNFVYECFLCFFQFSQWCASTPSLTLMTALNSANGTCLRWTMKVKVTRGKLKRGSTPWIILVWTETLPALVREPLFRLSVSKFLFRPTKNFNVPSPLLCLTAFSLGRMGSRKLVSSF